MKKISFNEEKHEYSLDGKKLPSVTQILKAAGLMDSFAFVREDVLDRAQDFGIKAHSMTALYDKDELDIFDLDSNLAPYLESWKKFLMDFSFVPKIIEEPMYSEKYGFAGTPDRIGTMYGDEVLVDIKTGAIQKSTAIQTAGYDILHPVKRRIGVRLMDTGLYEAREYKERTDKNVFLSCLNIFHWKAR